VARLVSELARLFPDDEVIPFTAWHDRRSLEATLGPLGLGAPAVRFPLPRVALYEAWHRIGAPPLDVSSRLRRADLVHAPFVAVPPRLRRPLVVSVHDAGFAIHPESYTDRGRKFHERGVRMAARRADLVLTGSDAAADELVEHTPIPRDRIRVIPYGVDHQPATPEEISTTLARFGLAATPFVLWVGTLEPRKNVGTLVAAFAELARRPGVEHSLVLVGPQGWLSEGLIAPADREALGPRLRLLGRVDDAELRALYASADVFALPSRHEGFGIPTLEAMAQATAVVCSDIPALREVAGGAARLVPVGSVDSWTDALAEVLGDRDVRDRLAEAGLRRAAAFSWERTALETRDAYVDVISR
jgi:glycosyltransferase involved in cell wall biosynthesis